MFLKFDTKLVKGLSKSELQKKYQEKINKIHSDLVNKKGPSSEMLGWYDYPNENHEKLLSEMQSVVKQWRSKKITDLVIVGMGGSYTGVKAILEMVIPNENDRKVKVHFIRSLASTSIFNILKNLKSQNWALVVISKSGTTLESAIGFKLARQVLKDQFKTDFASRIVAITDPNHGVLHDLCLKSGYKMFPIRSDIGGRYSSISPVGLFPALVAGVKVEDILSGAKAAKKDCSKNSLSQNSAYAYAAYRHWLYTQKKLDVEIFISYENNLEDTLLQHRQLFGESEGKNNNSLFPTYSVFTTDLHSMGQLYQDGKKIFFETVLTFKEPIANLAMKKSTFQNDDHLDYLTNKTLHEINYLACQATMQAHAAAGVQIMNIELENMSAYAFGYFYYWLCVATAASARLLDHDPFNQPGVEAYKQRMFKLLGKK